MKNRVEIRYLTIIGLSLTVVLTVCKENKPFNTPSAISHTLVKAQRLQMVSGPLADILNNGLLVSPKGTCFLFADSHLLTNSFLINNAVDLNWQLVNGYLPGTEWGHTAFSVISNPGKHLISYISEYTLDFNFHQHAPSKDLMAGYQTLAVLSPLKLKAKYVYDFTDVQHCIFLISPTRAGPSLI